ncbi:uncharacterized protein A4U43_C08F9410 [Asparagus officinalis]|nr:uncharacterized protein A4U43_C08F9410 [Asparagus officinalis]
MWSAAAVVTSLVVGGGGIGHGLVRAATCHRSGDMAEPTYKNLCQMELSQDSTDWGQGIPASLSQIGSQANTFTPILREIGDPTYQNALYYAMLVVSQWMMKPQYKEEPIRIEDEEEGNAIPEEPISKKYKKSKNETKGEGCMKDCGTPNKCWSKEESGFLLEFLTEQAANGNKNQKNSKSLF